jgi:hypothetical protein
MPAVAPIPGTTMTGLNLIKSAMRLIGVLSSGENPSDAEANDALAILNQLIDAWQIQRLMIYTVNRVALDTNGDPLTLEADQQDYTVYSSGDFDIPRPVRIEKASVVLTSGDTPVEIPIPILDEQQWRAVSVKNVSGALPTAVYDDGGFPFRTLSYWPIPNVGGLQAVLYCWTQLQQFADLVTEFAFPKGYLKALRYSLAVDLAPEFGVADVPPVVAIQAVRALAAIKSLNVPKMHLRNDAMNIGSSSRNRPNFNWLTGEVI